MTDRVREYLRKPIFDNWQWDEPEMLVLLRQMFIDLNLTIAFNIEVCPLYRGNVTSVADCITFFII